MGLVPEKVGVRKSFETQIVQVPEWTQEISMTTLLRFNDVMGKIMRSSEIQIIIRRALLVSRKDHILSEWNFYFQLCTSKRVGKKVGK